MYSISLRASDGRYDGYLEVAVEDVNEPPTITTTIRPSFTYKENGTATLSTFRATDSERSAITWTLSRSHDYSHQPHRLIRHD